MAGKTMTLGMFKQRVGDAVELRKVPDLLQITPAQVGALVKRKALPVHTFRAPDGRTLRMVRRADLRMVHASLSRPEPKLCDFVSALKVMAAQP